MVEVVNCLLLGLTAMEGCPTTMEAERAGAGCSAASLLLVFSLSENWW